MQAHSVDSCFFIKAHQITDLPLSPKKNRLSAQRKQSRQTVVAFMSDTRARHDLSSKRTRTYCVQELVSVNLGAFQIGL